MLGKLVLGTLALIGWATKRADTPRSAPAAGHESGNPEPAPAQGAPNPEAAPMRAARSSVDERFRRLLK